MAVVQDGPCGLWPLDTGCCTDIPADPLTWTDPQRLAVEIASEYLWRAVAGRFGLCREYVRPCRRDCPDEGYGQGVGYGPVLRDGVWFNRGCGCAGTCMCGPICEADLPGPVHMIEEVRLDGAVVPASAYRVDDGHLLVRVDGGCWPMCQHIDLPDTDVGTFAVTYDRGVPVPAAGRRAVALLACEILKQCTGQAGCVLPGRLVTVQREGVTYQLLDPMDWQKTGYTGLTEVDNWLVSVNPGNMRTPPSVWSPDLPRTRTHGHLPYPGGGF